MSKFRKTAPMIIIKKNEKLFSVSTLYKLSANIVIRIKAYATYRLKTKYNKRERHMSGY